MNFAGGGNVGGGVAFTCCALNSYVCASFRNRCAASYRAASIRPCAAAASDCADCAAPRASGSLRLAGSVATPYADSALRRSACARVVSETGGIAAFASVIASATSSIQRDAPLLYSPRCSVALAVCPPHSRNASPPSPCQGRPVTYSFRSSPIFVIAEEAWDNFVDRVDAPAGLADAISATSC
ncbi:hypothetical protein ACLB9X_22475 [Streptomyces sp. 5K101]